MAQVEFVCVDQHRDEVDGSGGSAVTVHEARWGFCLRGGSKNHVWNTVPPTAIEVLKSRIGKVAEGPINLDPEPAAG